MVDDCPYSPRRSTFVRQDPLILFYLPFTIKFPLEFLQSLPCLCCAPPLVEGYGLEFFFNHMYATEISSPLLVKLARTPFQCVLLEDRYIG
jgi:hypothetical protein